MNSGIIFIQLLLILCVAHALGRVAYWCGQPAVIGHLLAGVIAGPMVLGQYHPELRTYLFSNVVGLMALSKIGLVFIMFGLGLEVGKSEKTTGAVNGRGVVAIAVAGFLGAGLAGMLLGYFTHGTFAAGTDRGPYMLFFGVAMAATAVPVLAAILDDRRFLHHRLAPLVLNAAVVTDILAWFALSVVLVSLSSGGLRGIFFSSVTLVVLVIVAEFMISRRYSSAASAKPGADSTKVLVAALIVLFAFCVVTDLANAHVTIGAFIAGLAFRKHSVLREFWEKGPHALVSQFFTPLFFGTAAMNVAINAADWPELLMWAGVFFLVGGAGKVGMSYLSARVTGLSKSDALVVATLMNTKGVMEIILLTVGLEIGVISAQLYAILMVVALVATVITLPVVRLIPLSKAAPSATNTVLRSAHKESKKRPLMDSV